MNSAHFMRRRATSTVLEDTPVSLDVLFDILSVPRFADSEGERRIIDSYIMTLPGVTVDGFVNFWVKVGEGKTLFTAHTDTVHKARAPAQKYQLLYGDGMLTQEGSTCLGADCGTGIWLMLNMIEAGVPGMYLFPRQEELGRVGSEWIAEHTPWVFKELDIQRCVSFDRKGTTSVITHQSGQRCASDEFCLALIEQLKDEAHPFLLDDGGSYTDSYAFRGLVPECINLSVGYYDQHSRDESQDVPFATWLANRLIQVKWDELPTVRTPVLHDEDEGGARYYGYLSDTPRISGGYQEDILEVVKSYPDAVTAFLLDYGYGLDDLQEYL